MFLDVTTGRRVVTFVRFRLPVSQYLVDFNRERAQHRCLLLASLASQECYYDAPASTGVVTIDHEEWWTPAPASAGKCVNCCAWPALDRGSNAVGYSSSAALEQTLNTQSGVLTYIASA